ncbi:ATP synthase F1 subunit gamma [Parabacteroides sp. PF5-9]|uniref:ATP synthase F1 subunit gamma n=1 Tax=Parabacteroides sp. PF5-9 TaxID=1742404 RepID=UPI002473F52B|nr:ATP synthase F1 subunit gamma [Parabacteroides sp. PF5-9]MDH6358012.1 F-type H+-transporting ATPase subunit gamma [Parabacteroides sp. PF5-9]
MASLKEVKNRISSVGNTKKITQARQMVASAQLHQAQGLLENTSIYKESMDRLISSLLDHEEIESPYTQKQETGPVAIVIFSSNSGMCGSFNVNMTKVLHNIRAYYPEDPLLFFPIGKKIRESVEKEGFDIGFESGEEADHLAGKTTYQAAAEMVTHLMELYRSKKVKQVELIYYHFKNMAIQEIKEMTLLPFSMSKGFSNTPSNEKADFIMEPSKQQLLEELIPMVIKSNFYYVLMQNQTSEHAARTMAMQMATENADQILGELQLAYNKLRQQNITSELLDIIGSSFA